MAGDVVVFAFFWSSSSVDCHVVHIDHHASVGDEVSEDSVYYGLEHSW